MKVLVEYEYDNKRGGQIRFGFSAWDFTKELSPLQIFCANTRNVGAAIVQLKTYLDNTYKVSCGEHNSLRRASSRDSGLIEIVCHTAVGVEHA